MPKTTTKAPAKAKKTATKKVATKAVKKTAPAAKAARRVIEGEAGAKSPRRVIEGEAAAEVKKAKIVVPQGKNYYYANGKRKTSVAMVRLYEEGKGTITVNEKTFEQYFPVFTDQDKILSPLRLTNTVKAFDITVKVMGGGIHSQAEAVRHGVAKALLVYDNAMRITLKHAGYLTRDSRVKERKKYGLRRARRAPQFSKR